MNRRTFLMAVAGASAGCLGRRTPQLNVYNWENYFAANTLPRFEHEFGCRVRFATYTSAEEMLAKVLTGNSGWDVVFPSNSFIQPMRELNLLAKVDGRIVTNLHNLSDRFRHPEWDPKLEWSVPYMWGTTGILYSRSVPTPPTAWADLWRNEYQRRLTMLDDPAEVFAACLKRLSDSVNSADPVQLQKARDLAIAQKPLLRAYMNEEVRDQVVAGDVLVAQMWAQVAEVAIENAHNLAFAFPAEGFPMYADNVCILRESENQPLANDFINYLLRPEVAAEICVEMRTATVNAAARARLPETDRSNPVLYPGEDVLARGEWFRALPPAAQRLRDRYWTEIKAS